MLKKIVCFSAALFLCGFVFSENTVSESAADESVIDNQEKIVFNEQVLETKDKKHFLMAFSGTLASNLVIGSYNRFVTKSSWAQVTFDDICRPWEREVKFDRDWYWTNFVLHPYQGGLYHLSARNSNLNFYEGLFFTTLGSAMWEYCFELNAPSTNDLVYTSIGGSVVGEMLYRLSIESDSITPLAGFVINPLKHLTKTIIGFKPQATRGNIKELSIRTGFSAARAYASLSSDFETYRGETFKDSGETFPASICADFSVVYGNPYGHYSNKPYSQFELSIGGAFGKGSGSALQKWQEKIMWDVFITSNGMLFSRPIEGENTETSIGMVLDYDFRWHTFMMLSTLSPGFCIKQKINFEKSDFQWQFHGDVCLLATTELYYYNRNLVDTDAYLSSEYSYCFGPEIVLYTQWNAKSGHKLFCNLKALALYDFKNQKQAFGSTGWEYLCFLTGGYEFALNENISLGVEDELYLKESVYASLPDVFSVMNTGKFFVRFSFL